jgi:hypothetical protein
MVVGLFGLLIGIVGLVVVLFLAYLVIRIAVRDGVLDARRRP